MPTLPTSELPKPKSWMNLKRSSGYFYKKMERSRSQRYGRSGQPQQGVDVYGRPKELNGAYVGVQCKRYEEGKLNEKVIKDEIKKRKGMRKKKGIR